MRWLILAFVFQLGFGAIGLSKPLVVTGILLGAEGGNRIGSLRILADDRIWVARWSEETVFDDSVLTYRLIVGARVQCNLVRDSDDPLSASGFRAIEVRVIDKPKSHWHRLNAEVTTILDRFGESHRCSEILRDFANVDARSKEALRRACESCRMSQSTSTWGTASWAVAGVNGRTVFVLVNPVVFKGGTFSLELQYDLREERAQLVRVAIIDAIQYDRLFFESEK